MRIYKSSSVSLLLTETCYISWKAMTVVKIPSFYLILAVIHFIKRIYVLLTKNLTELSSEQLLLVSLPTPMKYLW